MADNLTPSERSRVMSRVRAVDTKPEMAIRRLLHRMGYRYRLHVSELPGRPDIVFPRAKKDRACTRLFLAPPSVPKRAQVLKIAPPVLAAQT